ncbi:Uncharacterized protein DBV15_01225, partial [Temnothorax longispinosus]
KHLRPYLEKCRYSAVSLTRSWHYTERGSSLYAIESTGRGNFSRAQALIRGGSPLDREERCLIGRLSDFGKFTATSRDKH